MDEPSDMLLLQEFAASGSERAFEVLVSRYLNLVYSTALRRVGDPHLAQDITQAVFIILAQKAKTLSRKVILPGWLYRTTLFAASDALKINSRRKRREHEMAMLNHETEPNDQCWELLVPYLDEAMERLSEKDRTALLLRYFEKRSFREVAEILGTSEDAAQKRVTRALEHLKDLLAHRSIKFSAVTLGFILTQWSVQAAPAGLALSTLTAVTSATAAPASAIAIVKGTLKTLLWQKIKLATVLSTPLILILGVQMALPKSFEPITVQLSWMESGVNAALNPGSVFPFENVILGPDRPEAVRNLPAGVTQPKYGEFLFGPKEQRRSINILLDEPEAGPSRLWIDQNGNGDYTDDPLPEWNYQATAYRHYSGQIGLQPIPGQSTNAWTLQLWRIAQDNPYFHLGSNRAQFFYCRDYARTGEIVLNGKSFRAMLDDMDASGDFRGIPTDERPRIYLYLDLNGDGKFFNRGEKFDTAKAFSIDGRSYQVENISPDGHQFTLAQADQTVPELPLLPDYVEGDVVPPFTRRTMDGRKVRFPVDYKGKLVLLDFWATWCSPCVAEIPNLKAVHSKWNRSGFEILGFSLEQAGSESSFRHFMQRHSIQWPQIYCPAMWDDDLVKHLGVSGIPHAVLVDGDTGEIVATSNVLRGEYLAATVESLLKKKQGSK